MFVASITSAEFQLRTEFTVPRDIFGFNGAAADQRRKPPELRLTPYAWAKLLSLRDAGPTEIGGFGISAPGQPLLVEDVRLVRQRCDWASVQLDDGAVADFFDEQVDRGRGPEEFARIWVHTHPGDSPAPSLTDEETFARVFGGCDWAVMLIVARGGATYARLQFGAGPGGNLEMPVEVAYDAAFPAADRAAWQGEYDACVEPVVGPRLAQQSRDGNDLASRPEFFDPWDWLEEYRLLESSNAQEAGDAHYD